MCIYWGSYVHLCARNEVSVIIPVARRTVPIQQCQTAPTMTHNRQFIITKVHMPNEPKMHHTTLQYLVTSAKSQVNHRIFLYQCTTNDKEMMPLKSLHIAILVIKINSSHHILALEQLNKIYIFYKRTSTLQIPIQGKGSNWDLLADQYLIQKTFNPKQWKNRKHPFTH